MNCRANELGRTNNTERMKILTAATVTKAFSENNSPMLAFAHPLKRGGSSMKRRCASVLNCVAIIFGSREVPLREIWTVLNAMYTNRQNQARLRPT